MKDSILNFINESSEGLIKTGVTLLVVLLTYFSIRLFRRYIDHTSERHRFAPQRSAGISKAGQTVIYMISIAIISNILGDGIQGLFVATSSFFALVGIAFFAHWSILSNVTASIILFFTFPYRIGDRLLIESEPKYCGILKDVTLMYLKIQTDGGSYITLPANVAVQKLITILSPSDYQKMLEEKEKKDDDGAV
ncbi:mechanosensitive ion channel family protein [Pelagicoccus sp. SDUM812005]|uniref:mechanosensitive ion channel family protein n=1 Tax=Pelagicoccus sp. SDUM812005 TaxID=3041257 RepID=UPI00280FA068|nr:mechanosensitive ion channel family protein [Pelagicoccus sp. SDUM812005]MDQ8181524.1 mechanosensitive ion channel family protein [Pelagicoccus sp. SDUM812005]